jgi:hypothetical protein
MATQRLLLPYNFTNRDRKALDFAVNTFAPQGDVEITLFHAYLSLPEERIRGRELTDRIQGGMGYLQAKISELETEFQNVRDELIDRGFPPARVRIVFRPRKKEVLNAILDLHRRERFNLIVVSRRPGRIGRFFAGSLHAKLIDALADVTICVVS